MAASVGVQLGHWAKYTLTGFLGEPGATSETISILRVSVSIVEYTRTLEYAHRSPFTDSFRGDVSQGTALPYIVPANLHEGDTIYDYPVLSKVEGITTRRRGFITYCCLRHLVWGQILLGSTNWYTC